MRRSKFSLSHYVLGTCKMGYMLPIGLTEVLPGDSFQHATSVFMRLAPMLAPVMHPVQVKIHHWFVPHRLVWDEFEDFITGGPDGLNVSEFPTVKAPSGGFAVGSLADHLGLPPEIPDLEVSALPFRAYSLIYNEWYRDQDLENVLPISMDSGLDTTTSQVLMRGDWERDYFTTARPWPQKGMEVTVPVGASNNFNLVSDGSMRFHNEKYPDDNTAYDAKLYSAPAVQGSNIGDAQFSYESGTGHQPGFVKYLSGIKVSADSDLGVLNINQLREAFALQRFMEARSMYGSRYVELLRNLGIKASDARLQRPEYLGGGKQTIQFSEVLQTAEGSDPVGTLRGHGIAAMRSNRYRRFFEEHGYVISILMIRPKSIYMQGVPRTWLRRVKEDFWTKELQHIGQQEVLTQELYGGAEPGTVFGYQNRYDDYRQHSSYVAGEFREELDYWHLARNFANEPVLNGDFISSVPSERIFAAQQSDQIYYMANHNIQARRLMAKFGNPI